MTGKEPKAFNDFRNADNPAMQTMEEAVWTEAQATCSILNISGPCNRAAPLGGNPGRDFPQYLRLECDETDAIKGRTVGRDLCHLHR